LTFNTEAGSLPSKCFPSGGICRVCIFMTLAPLLLA
jgi:hypothetical protein